MFLHRLKILLRKCKLNSKIRIERKSITITKAEKLRKSERSEVLQIDEVFVKRNLKKKEEE